MTDTHAISIKDIIAAVRQRDGFDRGRARSIANTKARLSGPTAAIRREFDIDRMMGNAQRGTASRIARKLGYDRRFTARILDGLLK